MSKELVSPFIWFPIFMIGFLAVGFVVGLYVFKKDRCPHCGKMTTHTLNEIDDKSRELIKRKILSLLILSKGNYKPIKQRV